MLDRTLLLNGIEKLRLDPKPEILDSLWTFIKEIEKWNGKFGLVNAEGQNLIIRHVLDSLAGAAPIGGRNPETLADIGSGAGFPGIPLSLYLPATSVTLVEPSEKRSAFLRNVAALLHIPGLKVFEGELERVTGSFDIVTFRAFRPLERKILKKLSGITKPGGAIAAYKGRLEKIDEEVKAAKTLGLETRVQQLEVPFLDEPRHIFWAIIPPS